MRAVERFLAAVRERDRAAAERLLARHPGVARADLFAASAAGEADSVAARLAAEPALAAVRHGPDGWTPLLYASGSPLHAAGPERAAGILRCAELLLDAGADPNDHTLFDASDPDSRIPALYWACIGDNVPLVDLLLTRGAEPNDGESLYHAAELDHRGCLELLLAHGAEPERPPPALEQHAALLPRRLEGAPSHPGHRRRGDALAPRARRRSQRHELHGARDAAPPRRG